MLLLTSSAQAETIYKSVDENGRVSYSSTPPGNSKELTRIKIQPAPSQHRIEAAQQNHERNLKAAELLDQNRKKRNEIIAEEHRLMLEKQKQLQKKTEQKESDDNTVYPYYLPRYPGLTLPPHKPGFDVPNIERPVQLPMQQR